MSLETVPDTQEESRDNEVLLPSMGTAAATRLCDPNSTTLPLHSTPLDEMSGTQGVQTLPGSQFMSPVFGIPTYPTGRTLTTQQAPDSELPFSHHKQPSGPPHSITT